MIDDFIMSAGCVVIFFSRDSGSFVHFILFMFNSGGTGIVNDVVELMNIN